MQDIETQLARVWNADARTTAQESWRCYATGAVRACIAMTWAAVSMDIITKIGHLADDGDSNAQAFRAKVEDAQSHGLKPAGVQAMLAIERTLLDKAVEFELVDDTEQQALERIREDRHLCVHPSLRPGGQLFDPAPDVARAHLAVALNALLVHPPTQGGKLLDKFKDYICDPAHVYAPDYIRRVYYDNVRTSTRKNLVKFAAKHAILELDPGGRLPADLHSDRMAGALEAFAHRDRGLVTEALLENASHFQHLDSDALWRCMARLGAQDYFWELVDDGMRSKLEKLVEARATPSVTMDSYTAAVWATVQNPRARAALPVLESRFAELWWVNRLAVITAHPAAYFVPAIVTLLEESGSWRNSEQIGDTLLTHASHLTVQTLREVLEAWQNNDQCAGANRMARTARHLFDLTEHLGTARFPVFARFQQAIAANAQRNGAGEWYYYRGLEEALLSVGAISNPTPYVAPTSPTAVLPPLADDE